MMGQWGGEPGRGSEVTSELRRTQPRAESEPSLSSQEQPEQRPWAGGGCWPEKLSMDGVGWEEGRERKLEGGECPEAFGFLFLSKWFH